MKENNINVLDEISKGCSMGENALKDIMDKADDNDFKKLLKKHLEQYEAISKKIEDLYDEYSDDEPHELNVMEKTMTWYGIQMRTMTDSSTSKLAELLMQGNNMGIIEGRRLLNNKEMSKDIEKVTDEFVKMQEKAVEELKEYL